jgi:hypothetical protein
MSRISQRLCTVALAAVFASAWAASAGATEIRSYGIGRMPCADFLANPEHIFQGSVWTLGYWTGLNVAGPEGSHMVGQHTEAEAIVADVKKACQAEPKIPLYGAIQHVYDRYRTEGK